MDTIQDSFNSAAGAGLSSVEWLIIWALVIDEAEREERRRDWHKAFHRRRAQGLPPIPPWPKP